MMLDIGRAFTFVRDDPRAVAKIAIGSGMLVAMVLAMLTVIGWIVPVLLINGYLVRLSRNVIAGDERPLPEWDNWGDLLRDGAKLTAVLFLFSLPVIAFSLLVVLPSLVLSSSTNETAKAIGVALTITTVLVAVVVGIAFGLAQPLIVGRYAATGEIGATLRFREVFGQLRANLVPYLLVLLLSVPIGLITNLGFLACGIGLFVTSFYAQLVSHHLYGQAYRLVQGATPIAAPTPPGLSQPFPA